jgi:hypothetical protein
MKSIYHGDFVYIFGKSQHEESSVWDPGNGVARYPLHVVLAVERYIKICTVAS